MLSLADNLAFRKDCEGLQAVIPNPTHTLPLPSANAASAVASVYSGSPRLRRPRRPDRTSGREAHVWDEETEVLVVGVGLHYELWCPGEHPPRVIESRHHRTQPVDDVARGRIRLLGPVVRYGAPAVRGRPGGGSECAFAV
jgi:hypothetical protein